MASRSRGTALQPTRGSLAREMFFGADERTPFRPGRFLETPQRLGIVPTFAYWNRKDVWKSARWFVAPVAGVSVFAFSQLPVLLERPVAGLVLGMIAGPTMVLGAMGLLERYLRAKIRARAGSRPDADRRLDRSDQDGL